MNTLWKYIGRMCSAVFFFFFFFAAVFILLIISQEIIMTCCMDDASWQGRKHCSEWCVHSSVQVNVVLGMTGTDYRMTRQATGVGVGSRQSVCVWECLCVSISICVLCLQTSDGMWGSRGKTVSLWVVYTCNLLRSDQLEPIMPHCFSFISHFFLSLGLCASILSPSFFFSLQWEPALLQRERWGKDGGREKRHTRKSLEDWWWEMEIGGWLGEQRRKVDGIEQ